LTESDETRWVAGAQQGDKAAFGQLVQAYQRRAYAAAYGYLRNRDDAMDVAQDSFVRAFRAIKRFETGRPFYPWLHQIVRNTSLNKIKQKKRRGEASLDTMMESGFDVSDPGQGPDGHAAAGDSREKLDAAMARLTEEHREILRLRHLIELSYAEIAEVLDVPQGTVMSRLHAARKKLRESVVWVEAQETNIAPGRVVEELAG